jgi:hypothetical protein
MKRIILLIGVLWLGFGLVSVNAQTTQQTDKEKAERQAREGAFDSRVDGLRNNGKQIYIRDRYKKDRIFIDVIRPLYRNDLTAEENFLLSPDDIYLKKYADYLKKKRSGVIKLVIDKGCDGGTETVVAKPECEKYQMPGAGSSYSFRARRYSMGRLADITYKGDSFDTVGLIKHGILVNLGDIPLDEVNLKTPSLQTLVTFEPITKFEEAELFSSVLAKGVKAGNLVFASSLKIKENNTYALRSVAYEATVYRQIQDTVYDEFDFDERDDVVIVFRVVNFDKGKSVTIVWKELDSKRVSKILLPKKYK